MTNPHPRHRPPTANQRQRARRETRVMRAAAQPVPVGEEMRFKMLGVCVLTGIALIARLALLG